MAGAALVTAAAKYAPAVVSAAKKVISEASPELREAARAALQRAGLSSAARNLQVTPQTAPVILQGMARHAPDSVRSAIGMLEQHAADAGIPELLASLRTSVSTAVAATSAHVTSPLGNLGDGDTLTKVALIEKAAPLFGGLGGLEIAMMALANLRPADINAYRALRQAMRS